MAPANSETQALRNSYASLAEREKQVMALVVSGRNRGKVMQKMKASSLADLVRLAAKLRLPAAPKA
jgi:FixJ family two-component response regulator